MFKKFFRKVRETVKKVAPIAAPIAGMALGPLAGMGIGALMGQYGGKKGSLQGALLGGLGGLGGDFFAKRGLFGPGKLGTNLIGNLAKNIPNSPLNVEGRGLLGSLQKILGGANLLQGNLGKFGLPALIGLLTKNQLEDQDMSQADINAYRSLSDIKNDSVFGGSPFLKDRFQGLAYDPVKEKSYDYITRDGEYKDFTVDDDGRIIEDIQVSRGFNKGGIAALNFGGAPHRMSFAINQQPVLKRAVGGEIFDPSMTGGEMMNEIKENPGITQYFPPKFGEITGPGGPKDDKIPAMLSDGEFVMTAKAVDNAGGPKAMYNLMNKLDPESSKGKGIIS